jgi:phosphatidylserine decarboxylase
MENPSMPAFSTTWTDHHYIERHTRRVVREAPVADRLIALLYSRVRESAPRLFDLLTSARSTDLLALLNYDMPTGNRRKTTRRLADRLGIDPAECLHPGIALSSPRCLFERKIRYWENRPMPADPAAVISPADARMLAGSFTRSSMLFIKEKFFDRRELLGDRSQWHGAFEQGDFAVFRLTPEKYHYNHTPVSGKVLDIYSIEGRFHSCNPGAVTRAATPYSKNRRVVTIIDTDVTGGSRVGLVAMIEVVALMIGGIHQCYSARRYDQPAPVRPGIFMEKGAPKSLYVPGSSVDVLLFEKGRITFSPDLIENMNRTGVPSRFADGLGRTLVETDVAVRSEIAKGAPA